VTERLRALDDDGLGRVLATAGRDLDWPPAPDLTARVSATLADQQQHPSLSRPRLSLPRRRRTVLLLVAVVVLLAAAAVAAKVVIDLGALHRHRDPHGRLPQPGDVPGQLRPGGPPALDLVQHLRVLGVELVVVHCP